MDDCQLDMDDFDYYMPGHGGDVFEVKAGILKRELAGTVFNKSGWIFGAGSDQSNYLGSNYLRISVTKERVVGRDVGWRDGARPVA